MESKNCVPCNVSAKKEIPTEDSYFFSSKVLLIDKLKNLNLILLV